MTIIKSVISYNLKTIINVILVKLVQFQKASFSMVVTVLGKESFIKDDSKKASTPIVTKPSLKLTAWSLEYLKAFAPIPTMEVGRVNSPSKAEST